MNNAGTAVDLPDEPIASSSVALPEPPVIAPSASASDIPESLSPVPSAVVGPTDSTMTPAQAVAAERLPKSGRISYTGTASLLSVMGLVSWEHDGIRFKARLGAGVIGATSSFNYESTGRLVGAQLVSESARDSRRGKETQAVIDNQAGVVRMQRGGDERERQISGLAVALSSLPQALACLDERIEKAALFVVGDFWVEDTVVINRGLEQLTLPGGSVEARRFQAKIRNGKTIDIWLAPAWRNAPARIRYDDGGVVVDLKATEVEIENKLLVKASVPSTE